MTSKELEVAPPKEDAEAQARVAGGALDTRTPDDLEADADALLAEADIPPEALENLARGEDDPSSSGTLADGSLILSSSDKLLLDPSSNLPATPGGGSALTQYMSQLGRHAPISREEEHSLAVQWREDGDVTAARQLVLSNLRLVVKIAMEYRRAWTNTLDLIQEGNVGLMEAVQRYDPYQGVKLSSYAVYWIRAYILKYILDNMRSVRLGTTRASRKLFFRLNKEKAALERQGFEAEPKLLAERLDVTEQDVLEMENRLSRPDTYLDAPARRDEGGSMTVGDTFATPGTSAESMVGDAELRRLFIEKTQEFAQGLGERDLRILEERILADEPRTLADMGEDFGVSRERVRQLEARLIKGLRKYVQENMVDFDYYTPPSEEKS